MSRCQLRDDHGEVLVVQFDTMPVPAPGTVICPAGATHAYKVSSDAVLAEVDLGTGAPVWMWVMTGRTAARPDYVPPIPAKPASRPPVMG